MILMLDGSKGLRENLEHKSFMLVKDIRMELMALELRVLMLDQMDLNQWESWKEYKRLASIVLRIPTGWTPQPTLTVSFCLAILFHSRELITTREVSSRQLGIWTTAQQPIQVTQARWLIKDILEMLFTICTLMDKSTQMSLSGITLKHSIPMIKDLSIILSIHLEPNIQTSTKCSIVKLQGRVLLTKNTLEALF